MIGFTHAILAYFLARILRLNAAVTILFALMPDIELGLNTFHRGILHSPLILLLIISFIFLIKKEYVLESLTGISSHLLLDSLTFQGLPLNYPINAIYHSLHFFNTQKIQLIITMTLIVLSTKKFKQINYTKYYLFLIIFFTTLLFFSKTTNHLPCVQEHTTIQDLSVREGEKVKTNGQICSELKFSKKYVQFNLCDQESKIKVKYSIKKPLLLKNPYCGKITNKELII